MNRSATDPSTRSRPPSAYRTAIAKRRNCTLLSKPAAVPAMLPVLTLVIRPATVTVTRVAVATGGGGRGGGGDGARWVAAGSASRATGGVRAGTVSGRGRTA